MWAVTAGKAYLCMGQLDEADAQYAKAVALEAGNAAFKAEAQLVGAVRSNLQEARQCLELGDPRSDPMLQTHAMQSSLPWQNASCCPTHHPQLFLVCRCLEKKLFHPPTLWRCRREQA